MKEKVKAKEAADITEDYSVVDVRDKTSLNVIIADEENWALEAEIAATVTELALDAASTVIEGKMRHNGGSYLFIYFILHTVFFLLTFHIIGSQYRSMYSVHTCRNLSISPSSALPATL